jgi:6-pyruvoyltetrahydropterin/6-carboxytetrahydropterin synthase
MLKRETTLYFNQGKFKFSAGHFTIFSATEREPLHGHNYTVEVMLTAEMQEPGITFDYRDVAEKLTQLCRQLSLQCLMPEKSPYLQITEDDQHYQITFNHESMWLLKSDVILMPLENITIETLSQWFVDQLTQDKLFLSQFPIKKIVIKVFNGPLHAASAQAIL